MKLKYYMLAMILACTTQMEMAMQNDNQMPGSEITTLFCHGNGGSSHCKTIVDDYKIPGSKVQAFEFDNSSIYGCVEGKVYLGQGPDIEAVKNTIESNTNYLLWGFSRGAAAAINYIASHNPENVKGLVIQSGLFDVTHIVDTYQDCFGIKIAPFRWMKESVLRIFIPSYPAGSTPPIQAILKIKNKDLPIFITHNQGDTLIPVSSAYKFYQELIKNGFTNVHFCDLEDGNHNEILNSDKLKKEINNFYKTHGFRKIQKNDGIVRQNQDETLKYVQKQMKLINIKSFIPYACTTAIAAYIFRKQIYNIAAWLVAKVA